MNQDRRKGRANLRLKVALDVAIWTLAALIAFPLRTPVAWPGLDRLILIYMLLGIPLHAALVVGFGLQRQVWRRVTVEDAEEVAAAVAVGTAILFLGGVLAHEAGTGFPRTVPLIAGTLALLGLTGVRTLTRLVSERREQQAAPAPGGPKRVLLVGAGSAGTRIARELRRHPSAGMQATGFLDDDPVKTGITITGLHVLGGLEDLPRVVSQRDVDEVLITMPVADGRTTRRVVELAREAAVGCRILPGVTQVLGGEARLSGIRDVQVEDLLRREPVELAMQAESYIHGVDVLVTGAGGSIGSELVRQVAHLDPRQIVLFGHGENTLHEIQQELRETMPSLNFRVVIGDIRDQAKIADTIGRYQPSVVFHAAAHKHVPLMEGDPDEAILNNVGGTRNLAEAACAGGVTRFVNVSTDKAVRPTSVLGITKSLAEQVVRTVGAAAGPDQVFASVRFGNVLGSRGSVVPVFQEQIRRGGPVRITDPEMTRYFMTIPEASRLVIQAGALGENGAVYVLDMGPPVKIVDLVRDMIHLTGTDDDIGIVFTGVRPGEKIHEELFSQDERLSATSYDQILIAHHAPALDEAFADSVSQLVRGAERRDWQEMSRCIKSLFPEYEGSIVPGSDPQMVAFDAAFFPRSSREHAART